MLAESNSDPGSGRTNHPLPDKSRQRSTFRPTDAGALYWPFVLASGLQLTYIVLFSSLLGRYETIAQGR